MSRLNKGIQALNNIYKERREKNFYRNKLAEEIEKVGGSPDAVVEYVKALYRNNLIWKHESNNIFRVKPENLKSALADRELNTDLSKPNKKEGGTTTVMVSREFHKELKKLKISKDFKRMEDVLLFLYNSKYGGDDGVE